MTGSLLRIYCDGASRGNPGLASGAFIVFGDKGKVVGKGGKFIGRATNNVAEYSAVYFALDWLNNYIKDNTVGQVMIFLDSQLVVNQLTGRYRVKDKKLLSLVMKVKCLERKFAVPVVYQEIPREKNRIADFFANKILDGRGH